MDFPIRILKIVNYLFFIFRFLKVCPKEEKKDIPEPLTAFNAICSVRVLEALDLEPVPVAPV